jgi:hypothetical protein
VGLGFFSVSLLDADPVAAASSTTSSTTSGAATTPAPTPTAGTAGPSPVVLTGQQETDGGTVYGSCTDGVLQFGSAPAAGWTVDDSSDVSSLVELKGGDRRIHVTATCGPTGPVFSVSVDGDDDSPAVTPAPAAPGTGTAPAVSPAPTAGVTPDDHGSGGHGSDDSGSDDSGGHGSGGHGSDD